MVTVVPALFVGTPDDSLAVVDVYGGAPTALDPLNLLPAASQSINAALTRALGMNTDPVNLFTKAVDFVVTGKKFNGRDFAETMITGVFPNAKGSFADLKTNLLGDLANSMGIPAASALATYRSVKNGDYESILRSLANTNPLAKFYIDGSTIVKNAEHIDSVGDLFKVAGQVFGNSTIGAVLNMQDQFTTYKAFVDIAMGLQVPELVDYLVGNVDDENKERLTNAAGYASAVNGDAKSLYSYIYRMNVAEVKAENPTILTDFIASYYYPDDTGPSPASMNMVIAILNKLEPDWLGAISGTPDVSIWISPSATMRELIYVDGRYAYLLAAAEGLVIEDLATCAARTEPHVTLIADTGINLV